MDYQRNLEACKTKATKLHKDYNLVKLSMPFFDILVVPFLWVVRVVVSFINAQGWSSRGVVLHIFGKGSLLEESHIFSFKNRTAQYGEKTSL